MDYAERIREESRVRCVWLRTKAMYCNRPQPGEPEPAQSFAAWWCLKSGEELGPDGAAACPGGCDAPGGISRRCYEGPPRI